MNYKLVEKPKKDQDRPFKLTIVADSNDADYITETRRFSKKEFEERILPGLNHLHQLASESHELESYDNEFDLPLPYSDWGSCHSLESVEVEFIDDSGKTWDVEIEYEKLDEENEELQ